MATRVRVVAVGLTDLGVPLVFRFGPFELGEVVVGLWVQAQAALLGCTLRFEVSACGTSADLPEEGSAFTPAGGVLVGLSVYGDGVFLPLSLVCTAGWRYLVGRVTLNAGGLGGGSIWCEVQPSRFGVFGKKR